MFVRDEELPILSLLDQNDLPEAISLTGNDLTVEQLVRVARRGAKVSLSSDAVGRIEASRATVDRSIARGDVVYGLNTELGPLADRQIHLDALEAFQRKTVVGHSVAHGEQLETAVVRAMILTRINGMAKGGAGVRLQLVEALAQLLNSGVHPIVRWDGSTGQSDLSEMAQIAGVLIGVGEAEYRGMRMPALAALKLASLPVMELQAKEGLGLISANGLTLGFGVLVLTDARLVLRGFDIAAALALEGFAANLSIIHPAASRMKPHPGHKRVAERLRTLLRGSYLQTVKQPRNLQDPLSFRCIPQVHGACADAMEQMRSILEMELNSASDNPLVSAEDDMIVSVGNFDVTNIAIALDMLRIALVHVIQIASERVQKQLWSHFSGLPTGLGTTDDPLALLIPLSRVCAAIAAEAKLAAAPVSLSYRSQVAEGIEDHASMAPYSVLKTFQLVKLAQKALAIELIVAAKAIDMRQVSALGVGTQAAYDLVASPQLNATTWKLQIERVVKLVANERFIDIVSEAAGGLEDEPSHSDSHDIGFYI
jgi:histidine ammonia-lyase